MVSIPQGFERPRSAVTIPQGFERQRQQAEMQPSDHFFARFGKDLQRRFGEQGAEIINRRVADEQGFASTALQLTGKVGAGSILDFLGEALISGGRGLQAITPDALEDAVVDTATKAGILFLDTELGRKGLEAAKEGMAKWQEFSAENPIAAKNIEAVTNIAVLATPIRGKKTTKTGDKLRKSALKSRVKTKRDFVDDLVTPRTTLKRAEEATKRTTEAATFNKKKVVALSPSQLASAKAVSGIRGISPKNTNQGNLNVMRGWVDREASRVVKVLEGHGAKGAYKPMEFAADMGEVVAKLQQNPALQGNAAASARSVLDQALRLSGKNDATLAGLLKTRKQLDTWASKHKPKIFEDSAAHSAITSAVREVRGEINRFIIKRSPHGKLISKSLGKQSAVLRAADDVAEKAAREANSRIARAFERAVKLIPIRNEIVAAMSLIWGVGGLGAAAMFLPFVQQILLGAGFFYGAKKVATSPNTRAGIAKLIDVLDRGVGAGARGGIAQTTDPDVIDDMKDDMKYLKQLLRDTEAEEE